MNKYLCVTEPPKKQHQQNSILIFTRRLNGIKRSSFAFWMLLFWGKGKEGEEEDMGMSNLRFSPESSYQTPPCIFCPSKPPPSVILKA